MSEKEKQDTFKYKTKKNLVFFKGIILRVFSIFCYATVIFNIPNLFLIIIRYFSNLDISQFSPIDNNYQISIYMGFLLGLIFYSFLGNWSLKKSNKDLSIKAKNNQSFFKFPSSLKRIITFKIKSSNKYFPFIHYFWSFCIIFLLAGIIKLILLGNTSLDLFSNLLVCLPLSFLFLNGSYKLIDLFTP